MMNIPDAKKIVKKAGGPVLLSKLIGGITPAAISQWSKIPPSRVLQIEEALNGEIKRHEMRPDYYPSN